MQKFTPTSQQVGLVVRGKNCHIDTPGLDAQHADCILPGGAPIGFFGSGQYSGNSVGSERLNAMGLNLNGQVYEYSKFRTYRPWYVDEKKAQEERVTSMVLLVDVSASEAALFSSYWNRLKAQPGSFQILGYNCSTHASDAFCHAGILGGGIPGLDTPDNLYRQLRAVRSKSTIYSGFVGFQPKGDGQFEVIIDA